MVIKPKLKSTSLLNIYESFLGLGILENILAAWYLFSLPTKTTRVFLAGFSLQRIGAGFVIIIILGVYIFLLYDGFRSRKFLKFITSQV
jgi:hypothetical protein